MPSKSCVISSCPLAEDPCPLIQLRYIEPVPEISNEVLMLIKTIVKIVYVKDGTVLGAGRASNIGWLLASAVFLLHTQKPHCEVILDFSEINNPVSELIQDSYRENLERLEKGNSIMKESGGEFR